MQIRLLTDAPGADVAIAEAKVRYNALKGGVRPRTVNSVCNGFLLRVVLNLDPVLDRVDITGGAGKPQEIVVISSSWEPYDFTNSLAAVPFRPMPQDPFTLRATRVFGGGYIWAYGGLSGKPVVLTVDPDVVAVTVAPWSHEDFAMVYPEIATLTETGLTISDAGQTYELLTGMIIYEFLIANLDWGDDVKSSFYLSQGAGNGYAAAPSLYGGTFIFAQYAWGQDPLNPNIIDGGWCVGGSMRVFFNNNEHVVMEGGFALGGSMGPTKRVGITLTGGPCLGGTVPATRRLIWRETMSGGFAFGGASRVTGLRWARLHGGCCIGGTMPVSSYNRRKQLVHIATSGGFAFGGSAVAKPKRTVKLTGGFCLGGTMQVAATTTTLKPVIVATSFTLAYTQRTGYKFYNTQLLTAPHYGGNIRFTVLAESGSPYEPSPGVTVTTASDAAGNAFINYSFAGSAFPASTYFIVRAREVYTAPDGTTKDVYGDPTQIKVTVLAAAQLVASGSTGYLTWTGGEGPYYISRYGVVQSTDGSGVTNLTVGTVSATAPKKVTIKTSGVCSEATAYFVVSDQAGRKSNQVLLSACGVPVCGSGGTDGGGDGEPGYLDIDFYLPKSSIAVGQSITLTPYPDSRGGAYSFSTGSANVATVSGNVVRGNAVGSTTITLTQQGKNGLNTTSLTKPLSVATNPWDLDWADFQVFVPTSKSCTTYTGSGYTVNFYKLIWVESRDGSYAVWAASENAYGCYTIGEDEYPSTTYATWPTADNPFPVAVPGLPWHLVTWDQLFEDFAGASAMFETMYPNKATQYYICYLYKRK